jgi:transcription elongation factor SPT5
MVCNALTRQGKEGPIEHIHRGILFIHDRHHLENGGFLCVRARACLALGGSHRGMERPKFGASMSNGLNSSVNVLQSPRRDTPYAPTGLCSQISLIMLLCFLACPFHCKMSV